jgi:hypothetical protein
MSFFVFIHSFVTLGVFMVYPLLSPVFASIENGPFLPAAHHKRRRFFASLAPTAGDAAAEETLLKIV